MAYFLDVVVFAADFRLPPSNCVRDEYACTSIKGEKFLRCGGSASQAALHKNMHTNRQKLFLAVIRRTGSGWLVLTML